MSLNNGINVRLPLQDRERLQAIALKSGVKSSVLIRQAIAEYCAKIESTGKVSFVVSEGLDPAKEPVGRERT